MDWTASQDDYDKLGLLGKAIRKGFGLQTVRKLASEIRNLNVQDADGNTILCLSCEQSNINITKFLIETNAKVDIPNINGEYPLYVAIKHKNNAGAKLLLENGADPNQITKGDTPLTLACRYNTQIIPHLVIAGIDIRAKTSSGESPEDILLANNPSYLKDFESLKSESDFIISAKRRELSKINKERDGTTILHIASKKGFKLAIKVLLKMGVNPLLTDRNGDTALITACAEKQSAVSELICGRAGINSPNLYNQEIYPIYAAIDSEYSYAIRMLLSRLGPNSIADGLTPLMYACKSNKGIRLIRDLIMLGASTEKKNDEGKTAIEIAIENGSERSVLAILGMRKSIEVLSKLSREVINKPIGDTTLLHISCLISDTRMSKVLLDKGADPNITDAEGDTPLITVCRRGYSCHIRNLVNAGAMTTTEKISGLYPLHIAIIKGRVRIVKELLDCGADPNIRAGGITPIMLAFSNIYSMETIGNLILGGADILERNTRDETAVDYAINSDITCVKYLESALSNIFSGMDSDDPIRIAIERLRKVIHEDILKRAQ